MIWHTKYNKEERRLSFLISRFKSEMKKIRKKILEYDENGVSEKDVKYVRLMNRYRLLKLKIVVLRNKLLKSLVFRGVNVYRLSKKYKNTLGVSEYEDYYG